MASRVHSRYTRTVADLACGGQQVRLILHVRKFFCYNSDCVRKIFTERLSPFLEPWARTTRRLSQVIETLGFSTCARAGARLGRRLGIQMSRMSVLRRIMSRPTAPAARVSVLGLDDFSFRRGRTFGTVLVDMECHQIIDLLPNRYVETVAAWIRSHPEITHISRDRGSDYAAAATQGAPHAIQVADRFHICQNLGEAVHVLLARVLPEIQSSQQEQAKEHVQQDTPSRSFEEWRPAQGQKVEQTIALRRAERESRYQQVVVLREQGLPSQHIAQHLRVSERTVRHWLQRGVAPDVRRRRKYHSDFDAYALYVLTRWQEGCRNGLDLWREIAAQGYPGSNRMVYRFLATLKTAEQVPLPGTHRLPLYPSKAAIWLFMRQFKDLDDIEQKDVMSFRQASPALATTYTLVQDFLEMVRHREGKRLEEWLIQAKKSGLPELQSFVHGVEQDQAAVQAGLTCSLNNGQVEGHVTKIKLIKRMMYGRAGFPLLRQRVLHAL